MRKWKVLLFVMITGGCLCACGTGEPAEKKGTPTPAATPTVVAEPTATTAPTATPKPTATVKPTATPTPVITEVPLFVDFTEGHSAKCEIADGWTNGNMFNVTWRKKNCTFHDGKMQLIIDTDSGNLPYSGAEYRTRGFQGYGRYEVSMKPIKNDGVVSSFFTYTGPSDKNPWDEIDIEFTGKDTTRVQFNYFTKGVGNHEYYYELGFDASEEFHTYAFEWHKDKIVWFVDGVEVHSATKTIPATRGKIMMNVWCGKGVDSWLKPFDDSNLPLTAEYEWFSYTPFAEE